MKNVRRIHTALGDDRTGRVSTSFLSSYSTARNRRTGISITGTGQRQRRREGLPQAREQ